MIRNLFLLLSLLLLVLTACAGGVESAAAPPTAVVGQLTAVTAEPIITQPAAASNAACPEVVAETKLLRNDAYGYCLLYPAAYQAVIDAPDNISIVLDSPLNSVDPRLGVTVTAANGRTAGQIADELVANMPDLGLERSQVTIGGLTAEMVDRVPGQDLYRRVFVINNGLLYTLFFSPVDEEKNNDGPMDAFFNPIINSFRFVPVVEGSPVLAGPECPEPTADSQLWRNERDGYCLLIPTGYSAEQTAAGKAVIFYGSMMNVEYAKLFIDVEEANGRELYQIFEEKLAEYEVFEVTGVFGLLLDGAPAVQLDNVPGQDLGRQIIAMYEGRLYTLTFVPLDEAAGPAYQEMEAMYSLVISSFNFLLP